VERRNSPVQRKSARRQLKHRSDTRRKYPAQPAHPSKLKEKDLSHPKEISHQHNLKIDLLNPSFEEEQRKHKKKWLVQSPNFYFMDVNCPGCYKITTVFSHAQTVVVCSAVLCQPTGGKARLTEDCFSSNDEEAERVDT